MIGLDVLRRAALVEGIVLAAMVALLFSHAILLVVRRRRLSPRLVRARVELAVAVTGGAGVLSALRALPSTAQRGVFMDLASSLAGPERAALATLGSSLGLVDGAVRLARSRFEMRRLHGARLLAALQARHPVLVELLRDSSPWVRAQAAEAAVSHPEPAVIAQLIRMLKDEAPLCRFTAKDSLLRLEGAGVPALAEFIAVEMEPAAVEAALEVAVGIAEPRFLDAALAKGAAPSATVRTRAARLLAAIGGPAATAQLELMLGDAAADVRAAAAAGLGALGDWPAAPAIALLLRDSAWDTRRAAGMALRGLGGPGELLLRRALTDADPFAADMARHVLDMPRTTATETYR